MKETEVVLITGASSGIGRCLCYQFVDGGTKELIVTARREEQLTSLKADIESKYACNVHVVPLDLAELTAADKLFSEVNLLGLELDVLVNNAGYGLAGQYLDTQWEDQEDLIRVLCTSPSKLIHLFLPELVARGTGGIVNVTSTSAYCPGTPYMTLYGALKHYQLVMTRSLSEELKSSGVTVTAVCPGATDTEWVDNSGSRGLFDLLPSWFISTPESVAKLAYDAYMNDKTHVITGVGAKVSAFFTNNMPVSMVLAQLAKGYK